MGRTRAGLIYVQAQPFYLLDLNFRHKPGFVIIRLDHAKVGPRWHIIC